MFISLFNCRRHPSKWIDLLSPLFTLDPLFRRTFLLVVPLSEFGRVASSEIFTPFEICTTLARILSEKKYVNEEEVQLYICVFNFSYTSCPDRVYYQEKWETFAFQKYKVI